MEAGQGLTVRKLQPMGARREGEASLSRVQRRRKRSAVAITLREEGDRERGIRGVGVGRASWVFLSFSLYIVVRGGVGISSDFFLSCGDAANVDHRQGGGGSEGEVEPSIRLNHHDDVRSSFNSKDSSVKIVVVAAKVVVSRTVIMRVNSGSRE
jgi:hypothetical protein